MKKLSLLLVLASAATAALAAPSAHANGPTLNLQRLDADKMRLEIKMKSAAAMHVNAKTQMNKHEAISTAMPEANKVLDAEKQKAVARFKEIKSSSLEMERQRAKAHLAPEKNVQLDSIIGRYSNEITKFRTVASYDEQGRITDEITKYYDTEGNLNGEESKVCYEYDGTRRTATLYEIDPATGQWLNMTKVVTDCDDHGFQTLYESYTWDTEKSVWIGEYKQERGRHYDDSGNVIGSLYKNYKWNKLKAYWTGTEGFDEIDTPTHKMRSSLSWTAKAQDWHPDNVVEEYYDEQGRNTMREEQNWNQDKQALIPVWKLEFEYTDNFIYTKNYYWSDELNDLYIGYYDEEELLENGGVIMTTYVRYSCYDDLTPVDKFKYTYDEKQRNTLHEKYTWDADSENWVLREKEENHYDEYDNLTYHEALSWGWDTDALVGMDKWEHYYDAEGNTTSETKYMWLSDTSEWVVTEKSELTENGSRLECFIYSDEGYGNHICEKYIFETNKAGQTTLFIKYSHFDDNHDEYHMTKQTLTYDDGGRLLSDNVYDKDTDGGYSDSTYTYTYNEDGELISIVEDLVNNYTDWKENIYHTYTFDYSIETVDGVMVKTKTKYGDGNLEAKYVYTYDKYGNIAKELEYGWYIYFENDEQKSEFVPGQLYEYEYDAEGRLLMSLDACYDAESKSWLYGTKNFCEYDEAGRVIRSGWAEFDNYGTHEWVIHSLTEELYSDSGEKVYASFYFWDYGINKLRGYYKYTKEGDALTSISTNYEWDEDAWDWRPDYKVVMTYDEKGRETSYNYYLWNTDMAPNDWFLQAYSNYKYDVYGNETYYENYYYNVDLKCYCGNSKYEREYNQLGQITYNAEYEWNYNRGEWKGVYRFESEYTPTGYCYKEAYYGWDIPGNKWEGVEIREEVLDDEENVIGEAFYDWIDDDWVGTSKYSSKTDSEHRVDINYGWNLEAADWYPANVTETIFDKDGRTVKVNYSEWDPEAGEIALVYYAVYYYSIDGSGIEDILNESGVNTIYRIDGVKVSGDVRSLSPGFYIINGKKVLVK